MVAAFEASAPIRYKPGPSGYGPENLVITTIKNAYEELAGVSATHWNEPAEVPDAEFKEHEIAASSFDIFARVLMQEIDPAIDEGRLNTLIEGAVWRRDRSVVQPETSSNP
jgi:hypothetical protein